MKVWKTIWGRVGRGTRKGSSSSSSSSSAVVRGRGKSTKGAKGGTRNKPRDEGMEDEDSSPLPAKKARREAAEEKDELCSPSGSFSSWLQKERGPGSTRICFLL